MAYHENTRRLLRSAEPTALGVRLGKMAVKKKLSVQDIALRTGASRTTIYSWFAGRGITNAYRNTVAALIEELRNQ